MSKTVANPGLVKPGELLALTGLLAVYLVTMVMVGDQGTFVVNLAGPALFGVILLLGAVPAAMRDANVIWTALFWLRIACAVYFGFGNVVTYFLNPVSQRAYESFFANYMDLITKLNAVTTLSVLIILTTAWVAYRIQNSQPQNFSSDIIAKVRIDSPKNMVKIGSIFLAVGMFIKFTLVLPAAFSEQPNIILGSLMNLSLLADAGIYLVAVWAWNYRPQFLFVPIGFALLEIVIGLLEFNKTDIIAAMMLVAMAWLSKGITLRRLAIVAVIFVATFSVIAPFVSASRNELDRRYHSIAGGSIGERLEIAGSYFTPKTTAVSDEQVGLMRLSYVNASTFALSLYDTGHPGGTMATLPATFVPRALWPDKPNMTIIGHEFNYLANGNENSASGPGWFSEAYWDYGWIGLPLIMIPIGIILYFWSNFSINMIKNGNWLYFLLCLLGMKLGSSPDGFIVPSVMGVTVMAVAAYWGLRLLVAINTNIHPETRPVGMSS